jgi:(p)ppGpp synthase/HD superfamily hydrolase
MGSNKAAYRGAAVEERCFVVLHKREKQHLFALRRGQCGVLSRISDELLGMCSAHGIECLQSGRIKTLHSTCQKMRRRGIGYASVLDGIGARIVVNDIAQCYEVLSGIRAQYVHYESQTRDYIVRPKANGYQSLHVSILSHDGWRVEVQIRTLAMHEFSEYGTAAHSRYKATKHRPPRIERHSGFHQSDSHLVIPRVEADGPNDQTSFD